MSRKSFPPRVRNKPTPGERETSLITPGFGIEFRLPLRVLVFRAIPRGFRSGHEYEVVYTRGEVSKVGTRFLDELVPLSK